ncbi:MAG: ROK family protein [Candidatus Bathyarchaeota archaeon]|jgi:glucokinase
MAFVAVDIGATNVRVASGNEKGLDKRITNRTDRENGPQGISQQIVEMVNELNLAEIEAIGVGTIGPVDIATGRIVNTPNLPFKEIPVILPLSEVYQVPVRILNDCAAAVLGERRFGAGIGLDNLVYVTFSTGLGGGAMVDGHLLIGKDGNAVEIGHLTIDPDSPLKCGCGCAGHWEAYSSGSGIPNFVRQDLVSSRSDSLILELADYDRESITAEILFEAAERGDAVALMLVRRLGEINAIGLADLINVFDPELVTIGGSIAINNSRMILEPILENINKHTINRIPEIMITPLGGEAVLYGALALALSLDTEY